MTEACHHHCHIVVAAVFNAVGVADRASWLYHRIDAGIVRYFHTVGEGEESIGSHHGAFQRQIEGRGLLDGLLKGVDTRGLPYSGSQQTAIGGKHYRIALAVFHYLVGEQQVGGQAAVGFVAGHGLEVVGSLGLAVGLLHQHATQSRAHAAGTSTMLR